MELIENNVGDNRAEEQASRDPNPNEKLESKREEIEKLKSRSF